VKLEGNVGTKTLEITLVDPGQILGPGSEFEIQRQAFRNEIASVLEAAKRAKVDSVDAYEQANRLGRVLQAASKERESWFKSVKQRIDAIKAPILSAEKEDCGSIDQEKLRLGREITAWDIKVRREREEEERKAREEAEKQAREEQLQRAVELEASGDLQQAEAVLEEAPYIPPVIIQAPTAPKVQGKVSRKTYKARVTDLKALVKAVADGKAPLGAIMADTSYINKQAANDKENFSMPGCELVVDEAAHFRV
jgi:hypothetical protein